MKQPRVEMLRITPAMAAFWLKKSKGHNFRNVNETHVQELVEAIQTKGWQITNDNICFDSDGHVVNGQNRLTAIVRLGITVVTPVMYNATDEAVRSMDRPWRRTLAQFLVASGYKNAPHLAAAVNAATLYEAGRLSSIGWAAGRGQNVDDQLMFLKSHPEIVDSVRFASSKCRLVKESEVSVLHYAASKAGYRSEVEQFVDSLRNGVTTSYNDPVRLLRTRLEDQVTAKARLTSQERFALIVKAWNAWIQGSQLRSLRWIATGPTAQEFPAFDFPARTEDESASA